MGDFELNFYSHLADKVYQNLLRDAMSDKVNENTNQDTNELLIAVQEYICNLTPSQKMLILKYKEQELIDHDENLDMAENTTEIDVGSAFQGEMQDHLQHDKLSDNDAAEIID